MISKPRLLLSATALLGVAVFFAAAVAIAQGPADDGTKTERSIHEQDIYIPYEKLREVFEKHGRGVFLPYEKFQELWRAAREKTPRAADEKPPVGALITEIENEATVEKDVVRVKAKLKIEVLAEGWNSIPLRLSDAAITRAALGGKPARIIGTPGQGYKLLIDKKGKQPETMELDIEYAKTIARAPGRNSVSFQSPQAPVSRWRVVIPQSGVKVDLHPLIAATEVPAEKTAEGDPTAKKPDETVILAFVGAAPMVRIDWTPKAEGATGLAAMASVQAEGQVWIDEGVSRCRTTLAYSISRAELAQLEIDVPAGQKVANLFDANIRQWSVKTVEGRQRITAQLFEPAKESQQVIVELEKFFPDRPKNSIDVPVVKAVGAGRQQGVVVVKVAESLRAEAVKTSGLLQVDAAELPPALKRTKWEFAYRYATVPFTLTLDIEKVQPRITVDSLLEVDLQPDRLTLDLTAVYTIEKAGVFRLEWDIPPGFDVRHVRGEPVGGAAAVQVDSHFIEGDNNNLVPTLRVGTHSLRRSASATGDDAERRGQPVPTEDRGNEDGSNKTRLAANLSRKAIGKVALRVRLQKDLHRPELLTPTGKAARFTLPIPRVPEAAAERSTGRMVVYAPESLRVNTEKTAGLRSISVREAFETMRPTRPPAPTEGRPVLAFAYSQGPAELTFAAERRKPQVTVRQLMVARVEEGVVKFDFTLFHDVRYSGVKSLRLDVPADVAAALRVVTPGVRENTIAPPPDDLEKGYVAWRLSGDAEFLGKGKIKLSWEKKIEKLDVGKSVELTMPRLIPREVDRAWGQIALVKSETIDVHPSGEPKLLRPIDPQRDLIDPVPAAARAFEFHDDWELKIVATRYELEEVKRTSIERALVRMVVTQADVISVQSLYRMRSARQRLTVQLPAGAEFDAQPLRIGGRPATLEKGGGNGYYIPLTGVGADKPFVIELRYTLKGDGSRIDPPVFPQEPAVVKEYLCVYLPETQKLLNAWGPWTEEFRWRCDGWLRWRPEPVPGPAALVDWVQGGLTPGNPAEDFAADGEPYLFSTLRPAPPPEGSLRFNTIDGRWLSGLVFIATVLLGLLLLPARLPARALAVGAAVIVLVLAGVFLPIFSMQVLNGVLLSAIFVVAVTWTAVAVARRSCRKPSKPEVGSRDHGVDLSKYQPEPSAPDAGESPKQDDGEGGRDNA
ncbi:MAG: hypothetical protein KKA28_03650 [Planctomycetes bacterium]|nr:hypothetical protein [Planctomycetota bacterium]MCG2682548.1 hypothetical protein [Planctomycetales bacterium]